MEQQHKLKFLVLLLSLKWLKQPKWTRSECENIQTWIWGATKSCQSCKAAKNSKLYNDLIFSNFSILYELFGFIVQMLKLLMGTTMNIILRFQMETGFCRMWSRFIVCKDCFLICAFVSFASSGRAKRSGLREKFVHTFNPSTFAVIKKVLLPSALLKVFICQPSSSKSLDDRVEHKYNCHV